MHEQFDFYPKVILADTTAEITILPMNDEALFMEDTEFRLNYYPYERYSIHGAYQYQPDILVKPQNGKITFTQHFYGEQEHKIVLTNIKTDEEHVFHFYSVKEDLFYRNPYKGDLHMHSNRSDGMESPEFVTAMCRKIGFDFMAITDHRLYQPSIEAQSFYQELSMDMLIARGEEVHAKNNNVHIINYGGDFSINDYIKNNENIYFQEVKAIEGTLQNVNDSASRFEIASSIWVFNKIREAHGLAIFCHPYWLVYQGYYVSEEVTSYLLEHQPYDAYEVIGGYRPFEEESNTLQIVRYYEEVAKGKNVPIVGVSDAHGCFNELFGWYYTITFAHSNKKEDIIESIKNCYSVGVENIPNESIRPNGPFRLVKYALYLAREYFPLHDALCSEQGHLMIDLINGDQSVYKKMQELNGQVDALIRKIFNR